MKTSLTIGRIVICTAIVTPCPAMLVFVARFPINTTAFVSAVVATETDLRNFNFCFFFHCLNTPFRNWYIFRNNTNAFVGAYCFKGIEYVFRRDNREIQILYTWRHSVHNRFNAPYIFTGQFRILRQMIMYNSIKANILSLPFFYAVIQKLHIRNIYSNIFIV